METKVHWRRVKKIKESVKYLISVGFTPELYAELFRMAQILNSDQKKSLLKNENIK
jgi:hypothetical protein